MESRILTVNGTGKVSIKPDYTIISVSLDTKDKAYEKAVEKASVQIELLRTSLINIGFQKNDLKTTSFNVQARYESERDNKGNYKSVFAGFECIHQLKLAFDFDMQKLSCVLDALSKSLTEPRLDVNFTVKDKSSVNEEVLRNAVANAVCQAEILASASGVKLGDIISINYNRSELNMLSNARFAIADNCRAAAPMAMEKSIDIEPEDIDVSDTVSITWQIL